MRPSPGAALLAALTTATPVAALLAPLAPAAAEPGRPSGRPGPAPAPGADVRELDSRSRPTDRPPSSRPRSAACCARRPPAPRRRRRQALAVPGVHRRDWGFQDYELRGVGDHIQVWVATDTAFPEGDCRNDLGLADITDEQVDDFVTEFDSNIYPKESTAFSVPPALKGENARCRAVVEGMPADYYLGTPTRPATRSSWSTTSRTRTTPTRARPTARPTSPGSSPAPSTCSPTAT